MKRIISFLFLIISFNLFSQPLDPFKDRRNDFLKMTEHNSRIWAKALDCGTSATNNDQLINCQMELKKDRKTFYQKKKEDRK